MDFYIIGLLFYDFLSFEQERNFLYKSLVDHFNERILGCLNLYDDRLTRMSLPMSKLMLKYVYES